MNFSIVLIAKNESKTLPRLVKSLEEFQARGGEIILLDTGSTDGTADIARQLGCKVTEVGEKFVTKISETLAEDINFEFVKKREDPIVVPGDKLFDYAAARNFAAELASNDMIATPDCDEIYTKIDLDKIQKLISSGVEQLEYNFVFSHDNNGNELIKFMHSKFYNRRKLKWVGVVHEVLQGAAKRQYVDEDIIKLEHYQNPSTHRGNYLKGLAVDCFMNPQNDRNIHYLGRELLWTNRPYSAIDLLEKHINMKAWPVEQAQSQIFIGDAYLMLGLEQSALLAYFTAITMDPGRREAFIRIAEHYYKKAAPQPAACFAAAALHVPWSNYFANYKPHYTYVPHEILSWALFMLGDKDGSRLHLEKALQFDPTNSKFLGNVRWIRNLPKVSFVIPTLGRSEGLKLCVESIKKLNYPQELIEIVIVSDGEQLEWNDERHVVMVQNDTRQGVPKSVKRGFELSTGDYIVYASNDVEFHPDSLIQAVLAAEDDNYKLVAFNTGPVSPDEGNICEHFLIDSEFVDAHLNGEIFDTEFFHVGVDNLLWAKAKKFGKVYRHPTAFVAHHHFSRTGKEMDDVAKIAWNEDRVKHDRELLAKKLTDLKNGYTVLN